MKIIELTKGRQAIVDDSDYKYLNQWKWHYSDGGYAHRSQHIRIGKNKYSCKKIRMHRVINNTPDGFITDHINRNKLDNRKCNLRTTNKSVNTINRGKPNNNTSGFKGVYLDSWTGKWRAELKLNRKKISLGRFVEIEDAIKARLDGEKLYYGI